MVKKDGINIKKLATGTVMATAISNLAYKTYASTINNEFDSNKSYLSNPIENGVDINVSLNNAIRKDNIDMVNTLLELGANLNENKYDPLTIAIIYKKKKIVQLLLDHGANVMDPSVLYTSIEFEVPEIVKLLLDYGANPNIENERGFSPLNKSVNMAVGKTGNKIQNQIAELLLEEGADVNAIDVNHMSPLSTAVVYNNIKLVKLLMKYNPDVNLVLDKRTNQTAINYLSFYGQNTVKILKLLINAGVNVNNCCDYWYDYYYPLEKAIVSNNIEAVEILLAAGADISFKSYAWSILNRNLKILKMLLSVDENPNRFGDKSLIMAIRLKDIKLVKTLIKGGIEITENVVNYVSTNYNLPISIFLLIAAVIFKTKEYKKYEHIIVNSPIMNKIETSRCFICLKEISHDKKELTCGHLVHKTCFENNNSTCPLCGPELQDNNVYYKPN